MFRLIKPMLSFGAGALALGLLIVAAPRAAHAISATLVQVTNTAANPAITQSVPSQAAQLVNLFATTAGGQLSTFTNISENNTYLPGYVVPANQYLVITSADLTAQECPVNVDLHVSSVAIQGWSVSGPNTLHFDYASGIVLAPGSTPSEVVYGLSTCQASLQMHGYLTTN